MNSHERNTAPGSVAISGDTAVFGAPLVSAAYVFVHMDRSRVQQAVLTATEGGPFDRFGSSVGVSDGTVVVGAGSIDNTGSRAYAQNVTEATATATVTVLAANVSGRVFWDYNGDGMLDGADAALGGIELFVDSNGNGAPDDGVPVTFSNDLGGYFFSGLEPGLLTVRAVLPPREGTTGRGGVRVILIPGQSLPGWDISVTGPASISLPLSAADIFAGSYPGPAAALAGALYRAVPGARLIPLARPPFRRDWPGHTGHPSGAPPARLARVPSERSKPIPGSCWATRPTLLGRRVGQRNWIRA